MEELNFPSFRERWTVVKRLHVYRTTFKASLIRQSLNSCMFAMEFQMLERSIHIVVETSSI